VGAILLAGLADLSVLILPHWAAGMLGFIVGYSVSMPSVEVFSGCITATLICFAQNPYVLQVSQSAPRRPAHSAARPQSLGSAVPVGM
jgi:hypothetical protein